jgi:hypothetical protein
MLASQFAHTVDVVHRPDAHNSSNPSQQSFALWSDSHKPRLCWNHRCSKRVVAPWCLVPVQPGQTTCGYYTTPRHKPATVRRLRVVTTCRYFQRCPSLCGNDSAQADDFGVARLYNRVTSSLQGVECYGPFSIFRVCCRHHLPDFKFKFNVVVCVARLVSGTRQFVQIVQTPKFQGGEYTGRLIFRLFLVCLDCT